MELQKTLYECYRWRANWGELVMARQRIELAPEEAEELSRRARATTVPVRDRQRAEIILLSAQGLAQQRIAVQQVLEQAVTPPPHLGRWSCRTMARAAAISPASVQRLWAASDIKPHLSR